MSSPIHAPACFAQSYAQARGLFLAAARAAGLDVHSHAHPLPGRDGEPLATDVARFGAADAEALLIVSSACHGVEGFCGSGVQNALLADAEFHRRAAAAGVAVLYVHGLNPWGFSWWRRWTHENVDLNRNFQDFDAAPALPANPGYDALAQALVPDTWPAPEADAVLYAYLAEHGPRAIQRAISGGQYNHPEGLFYGGAAPTWSNLTLRAILAEHASRCARLGWIDLHTALGPCGHGERIAHARPGDSAGLARARAWWGEQVTSLYGDDCVSAELAGNMWHLAYQACPQAEYTGIGLEYGTVPSEEVLMALRGDQWLSRHPEADAGTREAIKRRLRDAFYVDTDHWKERIVEQALDAAHQALDGLAARTGAPA
ncbi:M14 family metallopeptidase [Pseudomonas citronellolis]|uniref:M14 family metallopeptidase n=1 Tax=Pseudomonas citronellolis TaxID=53408 RepID=UPI0026494994|nr:M14 family metallopeptidase [Pseudomonas citronellolis]MDN6876522.1 M14 family metallopeptidase [Pseudomonas citronellolis]